MGGSWASAVLSTAPHATYRCILTGTPIPKSYSDLYNLFEFLWPKHTSYRGRESSGSRFRDKQRYRCCFQHLNQWLVLYSTAFGSKSWG
ncbi:MAG: hypothetical protein IPJ10_12580 [Flavobacteriales bacterium]|nr:hypothetical protein [Flavobacteriales bacterium]